MVNGFELCKGKTNYKRGCTTINTSDLLDIIEINVDEEYVNVEPLVTIGHLVKALYTRGYSLPVVPELDSLTVGDLIDGCGIGSSSKKYGLFQESCLSFEMVMSDGSLITSSKVKSEVTNPSNLALFYGIPWSYGSLGILVSAKLRIIPLKSFVKLTYIPCFSEEILHDVISEEAADSDNDFVEALLFRKHFGVVVKGTMFDKIDSQDEDCAVTGAWCEEPFYKHVKEIGDKRRIYTEYMPVLHYYHRHSRSIFWGLKKIEYLTNSCVFRHLFGWAMPPKMSLLKMFATHAVQSYYRKHHVTQGILVPLNHLNATIDFIDAEIEVYPIWLCPFALNPTTGFLRQTSGRRLMFCGICVYGDSLKCNAISLDNIKRIEQFVCSVSGFKMFIGKWCMSKSEFWDMFDSSLYDWLRLKYDCREAFPDVYEKICALSA
uniref:Delta(24)-sterol reductase n=1 Tax=Syphacia muris TaxID=451379 RepID=A0A0N5AGJ0_9BILA